MTFLYRALCLFQGLYFTVMGIWPLISIRTFQMVTGPKTDHIPTGLEADHWLVNTVAVLIVAIGVTLLSFARHRGLAEAAILAIGSAAGLTAIDVIYVSRRVIAPIYLADAAIEIVLIVLWLMWSLAHARKPSPVTGHQG